MEHNLEKQLILPTFVNLQRFIVGKRFVVKEAVLKKKSVLSHYIFTSSLP